VIVIKKNAAVCFLLLATCVASASDKGAMVEISSGSYAPLFKPVEGPVDIQVSAFLLDKYVVTNGDYLSFTTKYPRWNRKNIKPIFADQKYLAHLSISSDADVMGQPVTHVSWFTARAYCKAQGKRLPSSDEWEYAGQASKNKPNGNKDPAHRQMILDWYAKPANSDLPLATASVKNYWGVYGLHGVVWEWVDDFNNVLSSGESRGDSQLEQQLFCGAGAASSVDPSDYAAFMRYAVRSSLQANYTMASMGFRCAMNANE
jgi:sulfatase modifying factor 1